MLFGMTHDRILAVPEAAIADVIALGEHALDRMHAGPGINDPLCDALRGALGRLRMEARVLEGA